MNPVPLHLWHLFETFVLHTKHLEGLEPIAVLFPLQVLHFCNLENVIFYNNFLSNSSGNKFFNESDL